MALNLLSLEERIVLDATFTVDNNNDAGAGSLRQAVIDANANPGHDNIDFNQNISGQTITLTGVDLNVTDDVSINGLGTNNITVDGGGNSNIFVINGGNQTTDISGLKMTNALNEGIVLLDGHLNLNNSQVSNCVNAGGNGGGLRVEQNASATLNNAVISNNSADFGGGIFAAGGKLTLNDSTISGNTSNVGSGGGLMTWDWGRPGGLGAVEINNSQIINNTANGGGGGLYFHQNTGQVDIDNTNISGNSSSSGAGFFNESNDIMNLSDSTVNSNNATGGDGGGILNKGTLTINNTSIDSNNSTRNGGGIYNENSNLTINNSSLDSNNAAWSGGGIMTQQGNVAISDSSISGNQGGGTGGLHSGNSTVLVSESTIAGNNVTDIFGVGAGGVYNAIGTMTLNNSTISGNDVQGAIVGGKMSGGISNASGDLTVNNCTIYGNNSDSDGNGTGAESGGIGNNAAGGSIVNINSSIIAGNIGAGGVAVDMSSVVGADFQSVDHSLIQNQGNAVITNDNNNIKNVDPLLDPVLRNNGGSTLTHALLTGSPAIDNGSNPQAFNTDGRGTGYARTSGNGTDIGAFEFQVTPSAQEATPTNAPIANQESIDIGFLLGENMRYIPESTFSDFQTNPVFNNMDISDKGTSEILSEILKENLFESKKEPIFQDTPEVFVPDNTVDSEEIERLVQEVNSALKFIGGEDDFYKSLSTDISELKQLFENKQLEEINNILEKLKKRQASFRDNLGVENEKTSPVGERILGDFLDDLSVQVNRFFAAENNTFSNAAG